MMERIKLFQSGVSDAVDGIEGVGVRSGNAIRGVRGGEVVEKVDDCEALERDLRMDGRGFGSMR